MTVHAVEPSGHPAAARLEEADAQVGKAIAYAAHDHAGGGGHHLERVRDAMADGAPMALEAIHRERRLAALGAAVDANGDIQILRRGPQRIVFRRRGERGRCTDWAGRKRRESRVADGKFQFGDGEIDRLHRQHRDPEQAVRIGRQ